jgi:hypothetical protein
MEKNEVRFDSSSISAEVPTWWLENIFYNFVVTFIRVWCKGCMVALEASGIWFNSSHSDQR